jgi:hypothetical protein
MDNYRFYLPARVQCFKSSEQDFSPCLFLRWIIWSQGGDLDVCTSWYGVTHVLRLSSSLKWSINCESWQHLAQCACSCRFRTFTLQNLGVDKRLMFCSKCVLRHGEQDKVEVHDLGDKIILVLTFLTVLVLSSLSWEFSWWSLSWRGLVEICSPSFMEWVLDCRSCLVALVFLFHGSLHDAWTVLLLCKDVQVHVSLFSLYEFISGLPSLTFESFSCRG